MIAITGILEYCQGEYCIVVMYGMCSIELYKYLCLCSPSNRCVVQKIRFVVKAISILEFGGKNGIETHESGPLAF